MLRMVYDVCIRGDGIVGRSLALLLAQHDLRVALVGRTASYTHTAAKAPQHDVRAYALNAASRQTLQSLNTWPASKTSKASEIPACTAVHAMQIIDQTDTRTQSLHLRAAASDALAWIVDVPELEAALRAACACAQSIHLLTEPVPAPLQAICEGKASHTRTSLDLAFTPRPYHQVAIAARLHADQVHQQTAHQWFNAGEVLALLPLHGPQGTDWALVWSVQQAHAADYLALDAQAFAMRVQDITQAASGKLTLTSECVRWPLQVGCATQWVAQQAKETYVLVGDAAHSIHPLAGQGLNLGLADAALLAQTLTQRQNTRDYWRPLNDPKPLRAYARERMAANRAMAGVCDGLQSLFSQQNPAIQGLRQWGLRAVQNMPWLQRQAVYFAANTK